MSKYIVIYKKILIFDKNSVIHKTQVGGEMVYLAHYEKVEKEEKPAKEQRLKAHIEGTAAYAKEEGERLGIGQICELIALLHDQGKYSDGFQIYIKEDPEKRKKGSVNHTSAGAEVLVERYGQNKDSSMRMLTELLAYAITAHHGFYDMVDQDGQDMYGERLKKIEPAELQIIWSRWQKDMGLNEKALAERVRGAYLQFQNVFLRAVSEWGIRDKGEPFFYAGCLERLLLSIQIDADWTDTALALGDGENVIPMESGEIYPAAWQNYLHYIEALNRKVECRELSEKERTIFALRGQMQEECLDFTRHGPGIYRLSMPTGAGKTLSSLGYALKLAAESQRQKEQIKHIFYVSPFLSITEQNADVIKSVVGDSRWVLEHHSNVVNVEEDKHQFDTAWKEAIICTTMVQFLNTLFSEKKKSIRRFHQLKHAIVIVDEVQSLPVKTIHTFNLMMNFLQKVCHTTVILCTATQPTLDATVIKRKLLYSSPPDMIAGVDDKFMQFERVEISCELQDKKTLEGLGEEVKEAFATARSILVILNRKQTVAEFYDYMREQLADTDIYYLTTNLCARHRSDRIAEIKKNLNDREKKVLIVSTSLIEAGVDLSLECVFRSLAGLDSVAQAAGRCNRNGELERGKVTVFELKGDEPGRYMDELLVAGQKTREIVYGHGRQGERESIISPRWMERYYEIFYGELHNKMDFNLKASHKGETVYQLLSGGFSGGKSGRILKQAFLTAGREYQIIADEGITVVVPYGEGAGLIGRLEDGEGANVKAIVRKAQRYTVSIYGYQVEELKCSGIIRECPFLPGVYIAAGYEEEKGLTGALPFMSF